MKKASILFVLTIYCSMAFCQHVGISTTTPETPLHILSATDSTLLTLESSTVLAADKSMGMMFKKGNYYTAGIRSIGTSASTARLGFLTMSPGFGPVEMSERVSITHNGNMGIGTTTPSTLLHIGNYNGNKTTALTISTEGAYSSTIGNRYAILKLRHATDNWGFSIESYDGPSTAGLSFKTHNNDSAGVARMYIDRNSGNVGIGFTDPTSKLAVNGTGYFYNSSITDAAAVRGYSIVNSRFAPGVVGTGSSIGVLGNANTIDGIGLMGYNNVSNVTLQYIAGTGIYGFSSGGHGVAGATTKIASAGVYGISGTSGAYGGQFTGSGGALALLTSGPLRLTGISEGAGKVLTSDASGNATWQTPATTGGTVNNVSFSAHLTASIDVASGVTNTFSGSTTEYQLGTGFNSSEGLFIAPADGIYQFTFRISFLVRDTNPIYSTVALKVNGSTAVGGEFNDITPAFNSPSNKTLNYTKTMNLSAGANVALTYKLTQAAANSILVIGSSENASSFFSGIKLQ